LDDAVLPSNDMPLLEDTVWWLTGWFPRTVLRNKTWWRTMGWPNAELFWAEALSLRDQPEIRKVRSDIIEHVDWMGSL
jgi:hypothetical protein